MAKKARKLRKCKWVRTILEERNTKGEYKLLIKELQIHGHVYSFKYSRMSPTRFEELFGLVATHITKSYIRREALRPGERLPVALTDLKRKTGSSIPIVSAEIF